MFAHVVQEVTAPRHIHFGGWYRQEWNMAEWPALWPAADVSNHVSLFPASHFLQMPQLMSGGSCAAPPAV
eukprot:231190-Amphidinium_carterae.1